MKKIIILIFVLFTFNAFAIEKSTTFTNEIFVEAQKAGKTVVINSWNKSCGTCAMQIKVLQEAEKEFIDILFLSFEQTKYKEIAKFLDINFWTTIVIYKNNEQIAKAIGLVDKDEIYNLIKKGI
jgi:thiol-disulfide isomerase/thioredoxin